MPSSSTVRVEGLRELSRAFALAGDAEEKQFKKALADAAEPVRTEAEALAVSAIKVSRVPWWSMRVGVTRKSVYVAPTQRASRVTRRKRRELAPILMNEAMLPALDRNADDVERATDKMLGDVARLWEHV